MLCWQVYVVCHSYQDATHKVMGNCSVKFPVASCPPIAVTRQVYVPPSLVEVVLTARMCSL